MANENDLQIIRIEEVPQGFRVIKFNGIMDEETSSEARAKIEPMIADKNFKNLVFDLAGLSYINSKGIGFLVAMQAHLSKDDQKLAVVNPNEAVSDVMSLVGINQIIGMYNSLDEAYQGMV